MKKQNNTFTTLIKQFEPRYELRRVFDDFLTLALCSFSQNPVNKQSYDEPLYMETIGRYKEKYYTDYFPQMLACLTSEMEDRLSDSQGNDVLGEFFEQELSHGRNGQFFTPWNVCQFMANISHIDFTEDETEVTSIRLNILDPACGSGRMLLASAKNFHGHNFYGIDVDHTCVKMTAINLFLNGVFHGEVMCANALHPDDFTCSYKFSFLPFGLFRITDKEQSPLWHMHRDSFTKKASVDFENAPKLEERLVDKIHKEQGGSQLVLL
jgi:hypothetical protein